MLLLSRSALGILASLVVSLSAKATDSAPAPAELVAALTKQADDWDKAIVRKDRSAIEANMSEDFRQIDGDGDIVSRADFVKELVSDEINIRPYTVEDLDVRIYGDTALISGRTRMTGAIKGKAFHSHYRFIDIYVRQDGKWRIVSVQITRLKR